MVAQQNAYALEVKNINKTFFGNPVLKGISFGVQKGEVLGLLGSNGAGKSTLMKIINGVYQKDSGEILVNGQEVDIKDAQDALKNGIAMVYQDFSLIPTLTVAQNLYLGVEPKRAGLIRDGEIQRKTREALQEFGIDIDPQAELGSLSIGSQQLVEIVKALQKHPSVLILDEPTASLTSKEIELLFSVVARLKQQGIAIFFISHHMQEIMQICDRAVILRDGEVELNEPTSQLSVVQMVQAMVGKEISTEYLAPQREMPKDDPTLLCLQDVHYKNKVQGVSFSVKAGEVVGLAGLMGSGRTEVLECIFGIRKPDGGSITLKENPLPPGRPWASIESGTFLVPENRHRSGIVAIHSIKANMMMPIWKRFRGPLGLLNDKKASQTAEEMRKKLDINSTGVEQEVRNLSGGNQQKVVFVKSLLTQPQVLLLDEPTTGIDVEAKASIALLVRQVADAGSGVLVASSEMEELARVCDRVLVMRGGKISLELVRGRDEINETSLSEAIQA